MYKGSNVDVALIPATWRVMDYVRWFCFPFQTVPLFLPPVLAMPVLPSVSPRSCNSRPSPSLQALPPVMALLAQDLCDLLILLVSFAKYTLSLMCLQSLCSSLPSPSYWCFFAHVFFDLYNSYGLGYVTSTAPGAGPKRQRLQPLEAARTASERRQGTMLLWMNSTVTFS